MARLGLLLQRLSQFVEQSGILDGDRGLIGKGALAVC
jgi:hypothetical protein